MKDGKRGDQAQQQKKKRDAQRKRNHQQQLAKSMSRDLPMKEGTPVHQTDLPHDERKKGREMSRKTRKYKEIDETPVKTNEAVRPTDVRSLQGMGDGRVVLGGRISPETLARLRVLHPGKFTNG